jgi:two-component system nitrate/nitrite response regulator NarL
MSRFDPACAFRGVRTFTDWAFAQGFGSKPPAFRQERSTMSPIRVLIVSSNRLYREGLAQMLAQRAGVLVVGATADRAETVQDIGQRRPSVVLLDLTTPEASALAHDLVDSLPEVPIVALGVPDADQDVLACMEAGMAGYVGRGGSLEDLVLAVESAARGELNCSPRIAGGLMRRVAALAAARPADALQDRLTHRERQIVRLLERDLSNKEIAAALCIEVATVKNHMHNLFEKLHVHRRAHVVGRVREARATPGL